MFFSVILCVNKDNPYLNRAIESILSQDFEDFDFYIIANNCDDELYNKLLSIDNEHVVLHRTSIGQLSFNLNYAINLSNSEYIVRMDADDISKPERLSCLFQEILKKDKPDVIGSRAEYIDENDNIIGNFDVPLSNQEIRRTLSYRNAFIHPTVAIKRESILSEGGYLGGFNSEDYDLWLRMVRNSNYELCNVKERLLLYRINNGQSRGSRLAYSEVSGHLLKEALLNKNFSKAIGAMLAICKTIFRARS